MLKLYVKTNCAYCAVVLHKLDELGTSFEELNISEPVHRETVLEGGKLTVPYLIDEERGVDMYESADIVDYLDEHYAEKAEN